MDSGLPGLARTRSSSFYIQAARMEIGQTPSILIQGSSSTTATTKRLVMSFMRQAPAEIASYAMYSSSCIVLLHRALLSHRFLFSRNIPPRPAPDLSNSKG